MTYHPISCVSGISSRPYSMASMVRTDSEVSIFPLARTALREQISFIARVVPPLRPHHAPRGHAMGV
jgi:hypothetical protein